MKTSATAATRSLSLSPMNSCIHRTERKAGACRFLRSMRLPLLLPLLLFKSAPALPAEPLVSVSALSALNLLPSGEWKKVARIEGREGNPVPERWYILVNDPKDENGLHEYVVARGELVASRHISQFAEVIRPAEVFGGEPLRVDSDRAAKTAHQYADANGVTITSMDFEIRKDNARASLLWNVTCRDEAGKALGYVCLRARNGDVVSHEGFEEEPADIVAEKAKTHDRREVPTSSEHQHRPGRPGHSDDTARGETKKQSIPEPAQKPDFFFRLGGTMQKIFQR
jgi:hypothetical protein